MAHRYVDLDCDTPCPYCETVVPAGSSVCSSCGAAYMSVHRGFLTALVFFVVGWMLGDEGGVNPFLSGLIVALAGSVLSKIHANRNPRWVKGSW